jgi:iron complex transport system ATP-binding protein
MKQRTSVFEVSDTKVVRGGRAIVDDVSLTVRAGELLFVLGENGAGKSTLLRLLAGDITPDRGSVSLHGRPLPTWSALAQARERAVLPQQTSLAFAFTALEVVLLGRSPHDGGRPGTRDRAIAREALRRTDALQFADRAFPTLSGGERARVMLARVFAQVMRDDDAPGETRPRALLLDEPSAALDIAHQQAAFGAIRRLADEEGVAVVAVLHDLNLAAAFADRVALLKAGRLLAIGSVDDTLTEAALTECFSVRIGRVRHPLRDVPLLVALPE